MNITRRSVVAGIGVLGAGALLPGQTAAQTGIRRRHDLRSVDGEAMLRIYARAVTEMRKRDPSDPRSWTFQFYTHWVRGDLNKLTELNQYFGSAASPERDLANAMWSSCQAHGAGMKQKNFLPWHRAYVLCFEDIVREVTGEEAFTLPYWDYLDDPVLPVQFRSPSDPDFGVLFVQDRKPAINNGGQLSGLHNQAMSEPDFAGPVAGLGFSAKIDGNPHGRLHTQVGTGTNMGDPHYAAYDPVFWVHHCNIDRIWAGWNKQNHTNPTDSTWRTAKHTFADRQGNKAEFRNEQMTDIAPLGYEYDLLPQANGTPIVIAASMTARSAPVARTLEPIQLGGERSTISLEVTDREALESIRTLGDAQQQYVLVIGDLSARLAPETGFSVYALPRDGEVAGEGIFVGDINFFDARVGEQEASSESQFAFRLTDAAVNAGVAPGMLDALRYVIVPDEPIAEGAAPTIGRIELLQLTIEGGVRQ